MGQQFVCGSVGTLLGQQTGRRVEVATAYERVDLVGEWGHVADGDCPFVGVASCGLAREAELKGAVRPDV